MRVDLKDVKPAAEGHWRHLLSALAPTLSDALARPGRHVACPVHGGQNGDAFRLYRDVAQTGGGVCNSCGSFADGFDLLSWVNNWTLNEAIKAVASELGMTEERSQERRRNLPPPEPEEKGPDPEALRERMRAVWAESIPAFDVDARPLHLYLKRRGLVVELLEGLKSLRFHPELPYWDRDEKSGRMKMVGEFPAMVALIVDKNGQPASLHRTYLTPEGRKASVPSPKKITMSPVNISGGCIPLGPVRPTIHIAEGIETSLAVMQAMRVPVWPVINAAMMEAFYPPPGVKAVAIWADKDRTGVGLTAAKELKKRLWEEGIRCPIFLPPQDIPEGEKCLDWNDVLLYFGPDGFPNLRRRQAA